MLGSRADRELCREIAGRVGPGVPILAGRTRVADLMAVLSRSAALVGNDSGPAHVASALGVPVVQIFGPTAPRDGFAAFGDRTGIVQHPSLACRPCSRRGPRTCPRGHFRCMLEIPADRVIDRLFDMIRRPAKPSSDPRIAAAGSAR
jgi:heptosyltransferase-2